MSTETGKQGLRAPWVAFLTLVALTAAELAVLDARGGRAARITVLVGLLLTKVAVVLELFMHARSSRRSSRLTVLALLMAVGFAVVLMLEAAFKAQER
jgi:heme/copper-type cytochrome/quinol oxidase subunit 4